MLRYKLHAKLQGIEQINLINKMCKDNNDIRVLSSNYDGQEYYMDFATSTEHERGLLVYRLLFLMKVKEVW